MMSREDETNKAAMPLAKRRFSLTLMVNHACNLRCSYCYTGLKFTRSMSVATAQKAIINAVASTAAGGELELGFFGGEPLIEASLIEELIAFAAERCSVQQIGLQVNLTTNGTITTPEAWRVLRHPRVAVSISHDGLPEVHDRHRRTAEDHGSSATVLRTLRQLVSERPDVNVVLVVRPDSVEQLTAGIRALFDCGVRQMTPSLDLWTRWERVDSVRLGRAIADCADFWIRHVPRLAISWFDEKAAKLAQLPMNETARCQFGDGQIAVSPAGHLYPCERLIGEDLDDNPMRLPLKLMEISDFLKTDPFPAKAEPNCNACSLNSICGTTCRCSNFIRTGDVSRPDGLLCWLETSCIREVARVIGERANG